MSKLRFTISMSLDGYIAGPNQSLENPLGEGGEQFHDWAYNLKTFREMHGEPGGETGVSDDVLSEGFDNLGAHSWGGACSAVAPAPGTIRGRAGGARTRLTTR